MEKVTLEKAKSSRLRTKCLNCGRNTVLGRFCYLCRHKIPSGFSMRTSPDAIIAEIKRNEKAKAKFTSDIALGKLQVDTVNRIFHIDNGYYNVFDLAGFNFYTGEPRFTYGFTRSKVWEDIYFAFQFHGQERRIRKLKTVPCRYESTSLHVFVEPPLVMLNMKQLFTQMIEDERTRLGGTMERIADDRARLWEFEGFTNGED